MNIFRFGSLCLLAGSLVAATGCTEKTRPMDSSKAETTPPSHPTYKVDGATVGSVSGAVHTGGKRPSREFVDMSGDPACVAAHHGKATDESVFVGSNGAVANAFVYIEKGLEGKTFDVPQAPVIIDQRGCWFRPRVLGIQTAQVLQIVNSDPVTHNIHPMARVNREWNHSQGPGDAPLIRKFLKPEVMVQVKCNIHSWMHAFIGVVDHPYFAVTKEDGSFEIKNLPPGTYTLSVWHEKLGTSQRQVEVTPGNRSVTRFELERK